MTDRSKNVEEVLASGTRIEEFVIERALQSGGFGVTYLAQDRSLGRRVAIKEYLPREWGARRADGSVGPRSSSHEEDYRWGLTRFLEEARTLARLDHPRIVRVYRVIEAWGTAYMVMEYVEGRNLEEALRAEGPWPEARVRSLLEALLPGVGLVHGAGLVHRDIKPANVMLRADGTPVLIDFGAARYAAGVHSRSLTSVLTPGYAPYEQYSTAGKQGPWTDVYALGAVAYRALSGRAPVEATVRMDAVARAARDARAGKAPAGEGPDPDPLAPVAQAAAGGVGEAFGAAVTSALAVWPEDRPRDVVAWRTQWDGGEAVGTGSGIDAGDRSGSRKSRIRGAVRRAAYGVAALVVAAGVAVGIVTRGGDGNAVPPGDTAQAVPPGDTVQEEERGNVGAGGTTAANVTGSASSSPASGDAGDSGSASSPPDVGNAGESGSASSSPASGDAGESSSASGSPDVGNAGASVSPAATPAEVETALGLNRTAWRLIQTGLAREGFDPGSVDGDPGPRTRAALADWQRMQETDATGYLDAESMRTLREAGRTAELLLPASQFNGVVTDVTGGIIPGVTVEAAGPALIEGSRFAETDDAGRYLLGDLPPGVYTVTFTLDGFSTLVVEQQELPAGFTAAVDAELSVGVLEGIVINSDNSDCSRQVNLVAGRRTYERTVTLDGGCSSMHYPDGRPAVYYGFTLDQPATVVWEMFGDSVGAWLALRSGTPPGSDAALEENDYFGGRGVDARIERFLDAGSYTIEAARIIDDEFSSRWSSDDYRLTLTVAADPLQQPASQFTGVVTDSTGGDLAGVTVEAANPALIEGSRRAETDDAGRYLLGGLRPGVYTVKIAPPGFSSVVVERELQAGFTATVDATLSVGAYYRPAPVVVNGGVASDETLDFSSAPLAAIDFAGDQDVYRIVVTNHQIEERFGSTLSELEQMGIQPEVALYVYTTGDTDTFGELLNASGAVLEYDDDGGDGLNFRLLDWVGSGTYYVRVRHFDRDGAGLYQVFAVID